jgi:cytochrome c5
MVEPKEGIHVYNAVCLMTPEDEPVGIPSRGEEEDW